MKNFSIFRILFTAVLLFAGGQSFGKDDNPLLDKFSARLDALERIFWRFAALPDDHDSRPRLTKELRELENLARKITLSCISYDENAQNADCKKNQKCCADKNNAKGAKNLLAPKVKIPNIYNECIVLSRTYDQFRVNSKFKARRLVISPTGMAAYQKRYRKFMREQDIEEESETGKKRKKNTAKYNVRPKLHQVDVDDYQEFLDEIADKNDRAFARWADGIKGKEKINAAEQIFFGWQKSMVKMRVNLVLLAKYGVFKEEKKSNVGSNN